MSSRHNRRGSGSRNRTKRKKSYMSIDDLVSKMDNDKNYIKTEFNKDNKKYKLFNNTGLNTGYEYDYIIHMNKEYNTFYYKKKNKYYICKVTSNKIETIYGNIDTIIPIGNESAYIITRYGNRSVINNNVDVILPMTYSDIYYSKGTIFFKEKSWTDYEEIPLLNITQHKTYKVPKQSKKLLINDLPIVDYILY